MPADQLLNTVLELFQTVHDAAKTDQIIGTTISLLTTLSNPLNLGVLTSQLLVSPAIWHRRDGLKTSFRIVTIYHSAANRVRQGDHGKDVWPGVRHLSCDEWAKGVIKGCDEYSSRWQHLLVLAGILMGMANEEGQGTLSWGMRNTLEQAVAVAANLALERPLQDGPIAAASIVVALSFVMPHLSESHTNSINSNALLPITIMTMTGEEGFNRGEFISVVDKDIRPQHGQQIQWHASSASFQHLKQLETRPLMMGMGACVKVAIHAMLQATDSMMVLQAQESLLEFTRQILERWQTSVASGMEPAEEAQRLSPETVQTTWPVFWGVLKKVMYSTVATLQALMSRCLLDPYLRSDAIAPAVATKSLHILRNLCFISSRNGNGTFQVYSFTYLASIDIISRYPDAIVSMLRGILPNPSGGIPQHALHRTLDLFYLNLAEHLPLSLSPDACQTHIVQPATNHLSQTLPHSPLLRELFESAHSAILSVLSCPQNSSLAVELVPFYVDTLFSSFPELISPRQFRVAFKTIIQIVSPPFPVSATNPELSEVLLEMIRFRAMNANPVRLPPALDAVDQPPVSEQSALVLSLIDSLPFLPLPLVEEWLTTSARLMPQVADPDLRLNVWKRFWEVLESGEMDVERSSIAISWWYSGKGRAQVFEATGRSQPPMMSGAIVKDAADSRL